MLAALIRSDDRDEDDLEKSDDRSRRSLGYQTLENVSEELILAMRRR